MVAECVTVSMTLILGVYGSVTLQLGPNSSILVQPSPLFVQSVKVVCFTFCSHFRLDIGIVW